MIGQDDLGAGCVLPLAQAGVSGLLAALIVGVGAAYTGTESPVMLAALAGGLAAGAVWLSALRAWRRLAYALEDWAGADLNQDGAIGEPAPPVVVRVELAEDKGRMKIINLPASVDQLTALAAGLLSGATFAESTWTGAGQPFTRAEFAGLRAELIKRGLAAWNNPGTPARGVGLTAAGRAVMRQFANLTDAGPRGVSPALPRRE